jgi:formyltetrahydrofolate deformylase
MQSQSGEVSRQPTGSSMVGSVREDAGRLVLSCPNRPAIIAAVAGRLTAAGANVMVFDQFSTDPEGGRFYLRAEFLLSDLADRLADLRSRIAEIAEDYDSTSSRQ